jgi:hypothetical protein
MPVNRTSVRPDMGSADKAANSLGDKGRTKMGLAALREEVSALKKFKALMTRHGGKLKFEGHVE